MNAGIHMRLMQAADIEAVLDIQRHCYDEAKQESADAFLAKLAASPGSCFVAMLSGKPMAYLVAIPALADAPPPLHSEICELPSTPDALYLHDLAVHPRARGMGLAPALIQAYLAQLVETGLRFGSLTAVNDSMNFWQRHGFEPVDMVAALAHDLTCYGAGARYMRLDRGR